MPEYPSRRCQAAYDEVVPLPYHPSAVVLRPLADRARCTRIVDALSDSPARCPHRGSTWAAASTRAMSTLGRAAEAEAGAVATTAATSPRLAAPAASVDRMDMVLSPLVVQGGSRRPAVPGPPGAPPGR